MITQQQLKELFHYNPDSGVFTRLISSTGKHKAGLAAGGSASNGYIRIRVLGRQYQAHNLAWLYMTGKFPDLNIDHVNMVKTDNSWDNLREASTSENFKNRNAQSNNKLQIKNICKIKCGSFRVQVRSNGVCYGRSFKSIDDAINLAEKLRKEHHKSFSRS